MPNVGDTVCFYTHEQMDDTHRTLDRVALVLEVTENYVELKVFEKGKLPYDERAYAYSGPEYDAAGNPIVGKSYWREFNADAPDFDSDFSPSGSVEPEPPYDREVRLLEERQELERANWSGPAEQLDAKFALERKNVDERWGMSDEPNPPVDAQNPDLPPQSGQPTKLLLGQRHEPAPQVPPTIGNKSLPNPL